MGVRRAMGYALGVVLPPIVYVGLFSIVESHQLATGCESTGLFLCNEPAARTLLWPALILGRLGFSFSVPLVLLLAGVGLLLGRRTALRRVVESNRGPIVVGSATALYCIVAWLYVFELPVPKPTTWNLRAAFVKDLDDARFEEFFEIGYRIGMLSVSARPDAHFGESEGLGMLLGQSCGEKEWRSLLPPLTD